MPPPSWRQIGSLVLGGACLGLLGVVVARAWACDDAYVTFRVIDNFIHGHGLRWNTAECVEE